MKLHKLEIRHAGARVVRQGDAVPGGDSWIGRLAKDLAGAASRQQRRTPADLVLRAACVEEAHAHHRPTLDDQLRDERVIDRLHGWQAAHTLPQHAADLAAGRIAGVKDAPDAVRRLAPERQTSVRVPLEARAPLEQLAD